MSRNQYNAHISAKRALDRDELYRDRPPVTLPAPVTYTHDMFRAVPSGYGFDVRQEPLRRLDA